MGLVGAPFMPLLTGFAFDRPLVGWLGAVGLLAALGLDLIVEPRELLPPRWLSLEDGESWQDAASRFVDEILHEDQAERVL